MPIVLAYSKSLTGLQTVDVRVEADLANGLPNFIKVQLLWTSFNGSAQTMLLQVAKRHQWSRRVVDRLLRVAHTVSDLQACSTVTDEHMAMAIGLRRALDPPDALAHE